MSRLFDVTAGKSLEDTLKNGQELRVPMGSGIVGYVAQTGKALNIPDAYKVGNTLHYEVYLAF